MLVDHADAELISVFRGPYDDLFSVHEDLALIGKVDTGKHVHQRCLAAPVLAEQREDLTLMHGQGDVFVRGYFAERLAYSFQFNCIFSHSAYSCVNIVSFGL